MSDKSDTEKLTDLRSQLTEARAEHATQAAAYASTGAALAGVSMRDCAKRVEKLEAAVAEIESAIARASEHAKGAALKAARKSIAELSVRREYHAGKVDELVAALTQEIVDWLAIDDAIYAAWPLRRGDMPLALGRARVMSILRECMARTSAGVLSDTSPSLADRMRPAVVLTRDDNEQIAAALR